MYTTYTSVGTGSAGTFKLWNSHYGCRNLPPKVTYWKTDPISAQEVILDGFIADLYVNGTVTATVYIDSVAVSTQTITNTTTTGKSPASASIPTHASSRIVWCLRRGWNTRRRVTFNILIRSSRRVLKQNRYTSYVSPRHTFPTEVRLDNFSVDLNPLGNSVAASLYADNLLVSVNTFTGSARDRYVAKVPPETYCKQALVSFVATGTSNIAGGILSASGGTAGAVPGAMKIYGRGLQRCAGTRPRVELPGHLKSDAQRTLPPHLADDFKPRRVFATGTLMADSVVIAT